MKMANYFGALFGPIVVILVAPGVVGSPAPLPKPQILPGQIPSHIASHPALSSVAQGKESQLYQFAYNTANRRGPNPSPLVLQNNQERNLHLANQYSHQRSGSHQSYLANPSNQGHSHQGAGSNQNPEARALEELQRIKGGAPASAPISQGSNQYQPQPYTNGPNGGFQPQHGGHNAHNHQGQLSTPIGGDDNEREDIRRLKSLLNLPNGPLSNNAGVRGSPTIGVAGERGILNPTQFPQNRQSYPNSQHQQGFHNHGHDHGHSHTSTPFPATAQSQNALGSLQFGHGHGTQRPYPGNYGGPTGVPPLNVPYSSHPHDSRHHPHDSHYPQQGQDAQSLIKSVETPPESYRELIYIDPIREPTSINKHVQPGQSVFVLPASDYKSDDFQRLLNRPAEILIDVLPADGSKEGKDLELHNFSLMLSPSTYARCAQSTHKRGYGGKCKLILKVGKKTGTYPTPVTVSY